MTRALWLFLLALAAPAWVAPQGVTVTARLRWTYHGMEPGMKVYEPAPDKDLPLWKTATVRDATKLPVAGEIQDGDVAVRRGSERTVVLVYKNTGTKKIYFFAAPHAARPVRAALGFEFKCLCINHTYEVEPGEYWYRVVRLDLDKNFEGGELILTHDLATVNSERGKKYSLKEAMRRHLH